MASQEYALSDEQLDDLNSSLNVCLSDMKRDTSEFPPLDVLEEAKQCLECLANTPSKLVAQRAKFVSLSWPADLRVVVSRLFRTFKIPEQYIELSFELCSHTSKCLGEEWLKADSQFLRLLASMSSGRLRVIMGPPGEVNMAQLVACLQLQEYFLRCVEEGQEWMNDDDGAFLARCCQEAAQFVCEYCQVCVQQANNISMHMELFLCLYRFVCAFLGVGGGEILDQKLLEAVLPVLITVCKYCLSQRDFMTAWFLLSALPSFSSRLPSEMLSLTITYAGLALAAQNATAGEREQRVAECIAMLDQLTEERGDHEWYTNEALADLAQLGWSLRHKQQREAIQRIEQKLRDKMRTPQNGSGEK